MWGWRAAFVAAGVAGLMWSGLWLLATRGLPLDPIPDDAVETPGTAADAEPVPDYGPILTDRRTWAISIAKILSDSTWWLMLFWMPDFFHRTFGLSGTALGPPLAIAYTGAAIGALSFGSVSSALLARGWTVNRTRKTVMLVSALLVVPVSLALWSGDYWVVVTLLAVALAGHQGFSTSLFALIADVTPHEKVGRVTAFAAFCGNMGGVAVSKIAGLVLVAGLGYAPLFALCQRRLSACARLDTIAAAPPARDPRPRARPGPAH